MSQSTLIRAIRQQAVQRRALLQSIDVAVKLVLHLDELSVTDATTEGLGGNDALVEPFVS